MRRALWVAAGLGASGAIAALAATWGNATTAWGTAIRVPGSAAANSAVNIVSCATAGNCSAGGDGFVVNEKDGVWGDAIKVSIGREAGVLVMSCPTAASCAAGGAYAIRSHDGGGAFLVTEHDGVWGEAIDVPGLKRLTRGDAQVSALACAKPGFCTAGGSYADGRTPCGDGVRCYHHQAFVANESKGVWKKAIEVPGTARLNRGGNASVDAVSCPSAGNCVAAGTSGADAFVVRERRGVWGEAVTVRLSAAALSGGAAGIGAISCMTTGCDPLLNDVWGKSGPVPGLPDSASQASLTAISCPSARACMAGGEYSDDSQPMGYSQPFLVTESDGVWHDAFTVPGVVSLNLGTYAWLSSVSCASEGSCAAGGYYTDGSGDEQAYVVTETDGVWNNAIEVPGTAALNVGFGQLGPRLAVSCATATSCVAGGTYVDGHDNTQPFVTAP